MQTRQPGRTRGRRSGASLLVVQPAYQSARGLHRGIKRLPAAAVLHTAFKRFCSVAENEEVSHFQRRRPVQCSAMALCGFGLGGTMVGKEGNGCGCPVVQKGGGLWCNEFLNADRSWTRHGGVLRLQRAHR